MKEIYKRKKEAILISLASFTENYRKATTKELNLLWIESLKDLTMNEIAMGTRRCLTECEIFPTIAHFIEKAKTNPMERAGQWTDVPKIEHVRKRVQMPDEFRKMFKKLSESKKLNCQLLTTNFLPLRLTRHISPENH